MGFLSQFSTDFDEIFQGLFSSNCCEIFIKKYYIIQKFDHLTCRNVTKFEITTSLYKPIKLYQLKFVFSSELHYMPDGLTF